jgi:hypothetical protein
MLSLVFVEFGKAGIIFAVAGIILALRGILSAVLSLRLD